MKLELKVNEIRILTSKKCRTKLVIISLREHGIARYENKKTFILDLAVCHFLRPLCAILPIPCCTTYNSLLFPNSMNFSRQDDKVTQPNLKKMKSGLKPRIHSFEFFHRGFYAHSIPLR